MPGENRPHIICHMMMTIDGKITGGDDTDILDRYFGLYTETENQLPPHTGWMCGRVTMRMFASKDPVLLGNPQNPLPAGDFIAPHTDGACFFGVDTKGVLRWDKNTITLTNVGDPLHLVVIVTDATPKPYLSYLRDKQISYIISGPDEIRFDTVFTTMKQAFGIRTLLLEGGGILNGSVMSAGFVDEISILICPDVLNRSSAPSPFEQTQEEQTNLHSFTLTDVRKPGMDTVWLRYRKK